VGAHLTFGRDTKMKTRTRNIWIAVAILAILIFNPVTLMALWLVPAYWSNKHPEIGEHVDHVNWLPSTASDICYFKTYSNTAYEFNITENDFVNWAAKIKLSEIHEPYRIERYTRSLADRSEMPDGRGNPSWKDYGKNGIITINKGLCYSSPPRGNGGGMYYAYDRVSGRAYYQECPR
jgi:hypothetical protein